MRKKKKGGGRAEGKKRSKALVARVRRRLPGPAEIERDIERRVAGYELALAKPRKPQRASLKATKALNLIAHGDSWFNYPVSYDQHPFTDITVWLKEKFLPKGSKILVLAHYGDAMTDSFGTKKRKRLIDALQAGKSDAILFSGGGNDIIGESFHLFLNDAASVGNDSNRAINESAFQTRLDYVALYYRDLVSIRDTYAPHTPLFLHGYDFARPTNMGVAGCLLGPWLFPALQARGWMKKPKGNDLVVGSAIVRRMLERFNELLEEEIAAKHSDIIVVRTQGTITQPGLWDNETHLKADGFTKIAERFAKAIRARFP